jgi:hypothetical protein
MILFVCQLFSGVFMPYKDLEVRKAKAKLYSKKHYESNKPAQIERVRLGKIKKRAQWEAYKATLSCANCGENHPATLDFHHLIKDPSNRKISELSQNGAYKIAREEIEAKCIVLCANCHRKHHHEERKLKEGQITER